MSYVFVFIIFGAQNWNVLCECRKGRNEWDVSIQYTGDSLGN